MNVAGHGSQAPPSTANRSIAVRAQAKASAWELNAALTDDLLALVDAVAQHAQHAPLPQHIAAHDSGGESAKVTVRDDQRGGTDTANDVSTGISSHAVLQSSAAFYKWHSEMEAARASESEGKHAQHAQLLQQRLNACNDIMQQVDNTLAVFDTIEQQLAAVKQKTQSVDDSCKRLVHEKDRLVELSDCIASKLAYFDELERMSASFFGSPSFVDSPEFLPQLQRLDECVAWVASNMQFVESPAYIGKFRQLQSRALSMIRSKVHAAFKHAAQQVYDAVRASVGDAATPHANGTPRVSRLQIAEGSETALLYVRFRAAAEPLVKGLLNELEARAARGEYARLLLDCESLYCSTRQQLMGAIAQERIAALTHLPLPNLLRSGFAYLLQVAKQEHNLLDSFFPAAASQRGVLTSLMSPLCTVLYDAARPAFVQLHDVDEMCDLIDVLQQEILQDQLSRSSAAAAAALQPIAMRSMADIQERLIYRAQAYIRTDIADYNIAPHDVDYPNCLVAARQRRQNDDEAHDDVATTSDAANGDAVDDAALDGEGKDREETSEVVYPPLRRSLELLAKLWRCVDARTFGGLAQETVERCTASIQQASQMVARRSSTIDGQLFMIRNLLMLREHIAQFQADMSVTERDLNFSHMRDHVRRILSGHTSLFKLSADNPIVQLSQPRVRESVLDSKAALESQLKATCEAFIMALTKVAVEPMLSFITKVTAVQYTAVRSGAEPRSRPLKDQAFATPDKIKDIVEKVNSAMHSTLPAAAAQLQLYIDNASTRAILLRPIKANIAEAHAQIARLLTTEYSADDLADIPLLNATQLSAVLDRLV